MIITAFGSLFLPLILFVFLFRQRWLLPLLAVSAVLQSAAVAIFDGVNCLRPLFSKEMPEPLRKAILKDLDL